MKCLTTPESWTGGSPLDSHYLDASWLQNRFAASDFAVAEVIRVVGSAAAGEVAFVVATGHKYYEFGVGVGKAPVVELAKGHRNETGKTAVGVAR